MTPSGRTLKIYNCRQDKFWKLGRIWKRVNKENVAIAVARQITALQHKPLEMNESGFEVQTEYQETQMMKTDDTIQAVEQNSKPVENEKNKGHRKEIEPLITTLEEGTILNYNYILPTDGVDEYYLTVPGTAGRVIIPCSDISKQLNNGLVKNDGETKTENKKTKQNVANLLGKQNKMGAY